MKEKLLFMEQPDTTAIISYPELQFPDGITMHGVSVRIKLDYDHNTQQPELYVHIQSDTESYGNILLDKIFQLPCECDMDNTPLEDTKHE